MVFPKFRYAIDTKWEKSTNTSDTTLDIHIQQKYRPRRKLEEITFFNGLSGCWFLLLFFQKIVQSVAKFTDTSRSLLTIR